MKLAREEWERERDKVVRRAANHVWCHNTKYVAVTV